MKLNPDALGGHLEQKLLGAYLISGDEPLLTGEAAAAIRQRARAEGFTERTVHFIERASDWDDVRGSAGSLSLFGARRLIEIRLNTGKPGAAGAAAIGALLGLGADDTLFLLLAPRLDRDAQGSTWVKAVETHGAWVQVWPVSIEKFPGWLRMRARRLSLDISADGLGLLAERTEGNLLAAQQELDKLALIYPAGEISADMILASVGDSARFDVFQLGEVVLAGELERALRILSGLRSEGAEPTLVLWALTKAIRDLWGVLRAPAEAASRVWSRQLVALQKGAERAARLSFRALVIRAGRADRMVKGRLAGDAWDEMMLLAAEICGRQIVRTPETVLK